MLAIHFADVGRPGQKSESSGFAPDGRPETFRLIADVGVQVADEAEHHAQDMIGDDIGEEPFHIRQDGGMRDEFGEHEVFQAHRRRLDPLQFRGCGEEPGSDLPVEAIGIDDLREGFFDAFGVDDMGWPGGFADGFGANGFQRRVADEFPAHPITVCMQSSRLQLKRGGIRSWRSNDDASSPKVPAMPTRPNDPDLIKVTELLLVPSSFMVAALGTADTNAHRAAVSLLGLIVSILWWVAVHDAYHHPNPGVEDGAMSPLRTRLLYQLPVIFGVGWLISLAAHLMLWGKPIGTT